jgi:glycosyltransferase involved in cell wall biosynthesis
MNAAAERAHVSLGVVAISHNEENDLPAFLEHLLPWVDEIVIVDDGSIDRTAAISRGAHEKVKFAASPRQTGEYYSHQRNKGISMATSEWLLHMDIDERVTPELAAEILAAIKDPGRDGYRFRRVNYFLNRPMLGGGWQTWNQIHLARRTKFHFGGKMHETTLLDAPPQGVGQLAHPMWHLNDSDYVERVRKNMTYMQVEAENLIEKHFRVRWFDFILQPLKRVIKSYFLQGGYRDGVMGVLYATYVFGATFNAYATAWDRQNPASREAVETELRNLWLARGTTP